MKKYLGDSVYVEYIGHDLILTTENGYADDPRNLIFLEPSVYNSLLEFVNRNVENPEFMKVLKCT